MFASHILAGVSGTGARAVARDVLLVVGAAVVLAVAAKAQVPHFPVPATLQTLAVVVLGMLLGPGRAVSAVALYLVQGAAGIPVFAGAVAGPAYFAGPTAGFLLGFLPAAALAGFLAQRGMNQTLLRTLAAVFIADAVVFACGLSWLAEFLGGDFSKAVALGFVPFVGVETSKLIVAACIVFITSHPPGSGSDRSDSGNSGDSGSDSRPS